MPVLWLSCAIVIARRWSENALTTARPRAMEVMKLGSVSASISCAMVSGGVDVGKGIGDAMGATVGCVVVDGAPCCSDVASSGGRGAV